MRKLYLSCHFVCIGLHFSRCFTPLVRPASQRNWQQRLICSQTEIRLYKCVYSCCNPALGPSLPPLLFISDYSSSTLREKGLYVVWESACLPPSLPPSPVGREGVSTKEIPKVPLQWHRRTLWKPTCPLTLQHILTRTLKTNQESMESPLHHYL